MRKKAGRTKRRKGRDKKEERAWKRRGKIKNIGRQRKRESVRNRKEE